MNEAVASATKEQERDPRARPRAALRRRTTASDVRSEGLQIAADLREMGDSLRSNAERLLRDVQRIHSQLVARLDRIDAARPRAGTGTGEHGDR